MTDLQNITRVIARVACLVCQIPRQNGGIVTIQYASQAILAQYDSCDVVLILCLQPSFACCTRLLSRACQALPSIGAEHMHDASHKVHFRAEEHCGHIVTTEI